MVAAPDDEPVIQIGVREYVDREVARALREIERQFVTVETARVIAQSAVNNKEQRAVDLGRFSLERLMALAAIGVALYAVLSR